MYETNTRRWLLLFREVGVPSKEGNGRHATLQALAEALRQSQSYPTVITDGLAGQATTRTHPWPGYVQ